MVDIRGLKDFSELLDKRPWYDFRVIETFNFFDILLN